jgi:hypothetical protein
VNLASGASRVAALCEEGSSYQSSSSHAVSGVIQRVSCAVNGTKASLKPSRITVMHDICAGTTHFEKGVDNL